MVAVVIDRALTAAIVIVVSEKFGPEASEAISVRTLVAEIVTAAVTTGSSSAAAPVGPSTAEATSEPATATATATGLRGLDSGKGEQAHGQGHGCGERYFSEAAIPHKVAHISYPCYYVPTTIGLIFCSTWYVRQRTTRHNVLNIVFI
jgi:hypothetical protein